jgi:hypothetical protein
LQVGHDFSTTTTLDAEDQAIARQLVSDLVPDSPVIGSGMAAHIHERIPEFTGYADETVLLGSTEASCTANIDQILRMLGSGAHPHTLVLPEPAIEYAQGLVHRRTPLATLLRSYRLGHGYFLNVATSRLRDGIDDEGVLVRSLEAASNFTFEYIDTISDKLVEAYHVERDRWVRTAAAVRAETVRNIIDGQTVNERGASSRLGYELRRWHIALILSGGQDAAPGDVRSLEREAIEAAAHIGCGDPLLIPAGSGMLWAWCGTFKPPGPGALTALESHHPANGVRMAVGRPVYGLEGFRVSHQEASHAARFWELGAASAGGTTSYRNIEVVSLLAADIDRARRFVLAELGPLGEQSEGAARMRTTLLGFLAHGCSHVRAAQELHMHQNTVYNRVRRAEELLGASVTERRVELQTALMLAETLGAEVLI